MSNAATRKSAGAVSVLEECRDELYAVAVTADGRMAVSGSDDCALQVWDLTNVRLVRTLYGHTSIVLSVAITSDGTRAISGSFDSTFRVWNLTTAQQVAILAGHLSETPTGALTADGRKAVTSTRGAGINVWDLSTGQIVATLNGHTASVSAVAVTVDGRRVVSGSHDSTVRIWDLETGNAVGTLEGHADSILSVAVTANGKKAISGSRDKTIRIWNLETGNSIGTLSGHTSDVISVAITADGKMAVSGSRDNTIRVWDIATCQAVAILEGHTSIVQSVAVTANGALAISASIDHTLRLWDLNGLREASYTNAKVLFVGDSGVGKTGLAHRLTMGRPPGQLISTDAAWATQWSLPQDPKAYVGEREIWLWDFAGQPDYRLAHPLYMDDTALAVFVFDPQDLNPIAGIAEWDRMMTRAAKKPFAKLLVAGRCDRGRLMISRDVIDQFCKDHHFGRYFETSAHTGDGCDELKTAMITSIDWDAIPYTVSSETFRKLKQIIVSLKDRADEYIVNHKERPATPVLLSSDALAVMVRTEWKDEQKFSEDEFRAVVGLLHGPGVVWKLEFGDLVLLQPERINAYAAALVRKVRKHIDEIGVIPETEVLAGDLDYADMSRLPKEDEEIVLRAMHVMVVDRRLCIRQHVTNGNSLLIFPSLYMRKRPERPSHPLLLMTFRFEGHLDEIYATLVVHLHHTDAFKEKQLWLDAADFESLTGEKIGLKMIRHEGRGEITVFANEDVTEISRLQFVKYIYEYLKSKDPNCARIRHYVCTYHKCRAAFADTAAIDRAGQKKQKHVYCALCGRKITLDDVIEKRFSADAMAAQARGMQIQAQTVLDNESKELILVGHSYVIAGEAGQIYRQYTNSDHGIDGEIELKKDDGDASSVLLYLQLKSGDSYISTRKDGTEVFTGFKERHVEYWRVRKYPVMLVIRTSDGRIRWMDVRAYLQKEKDAGRDVKQIVFNGEPFTAAALRAMRDKVLGTASARR